MKILSDREKETLDLNAIRVLEEDLLNWHRLGRNKFFYRLEHRKFSLDIHLIGESCNYYANIATKQGKWLEVDVASPKASTPWEDVKKYYLIHAKNIYFRYRDKLRENNG